MNGIQPPLVPTLPIQTVNLKVNVGLGDVNLMRSQIYAKTEGKYFHVLCTIQNINVQILDVNGKLTTTILISTDYVLQSELKLPQEIYVRISFF